LARGFDDRLLRPDDLGFKLASRQEVEPALMGERVVADSVSSLNNRPKVREICRTDGIGAHHKHRDLQAQAIQQVEGLGHESGEI
jgi:hypothetical protein